MKLKYNCSDCEASAIAPISMWGALQKNRISVVTEGSIFFAVGTVTGSVSDA